MTFVLMFSFCVGASSSLQGRCSVVVPEPLGAGHGGNPTVPLSHHRMNQNATV
jgi:hypothetical protein